MPKFFFHLHSGDGFSEDDGGIDLETAGCAREVAIEGIRSIVAEEALEGSLDLTGHVNIKDEQDNLLSHVTFVEAFELSANGVRHAYGSGKGDMPAD